MEKRTAFDAFARIKAMTAAVNTHVTAGEYNYTHPHSSSNKVVWSTDCCLHQVPARSAANLRIVLERFLQSRRNTIICAPIDGGTPH
jgi:hypothetical protein